MLEVVLLPTYLRIRSYKIKVGETAPEVDSARLLDAIIHSLEGKITILQDSALGLQNWQR